MRLLLFLFDAATALCSLRGMIYKKDDGRWYLRNPFRKTKAPVEEESDPFYHPSDQLKTRSGSLIMSDHVDAIRERIYGATPCVPPTWVDDKRKRIRNLPGLNAASVQGLDKRETGESYAPPPPPPAGDSAPPDDDELPF